MKHYSEVYPEEMIYIHNPIDTDARGCNGVHRYKRTFIWRAVTPTGRKSKYWSSFATKSSDEAGHEKHTPYKLPKGYTWSGPYLYP